MNLVFGENRLHSLFIQEGRRPVGIGRERDATFFFLVEHDRRRLLVETNPYALQFVFDQLAVRKRLERVEDDDDHIARARRRDHLSTATLVIFRTLDDPREIQKLNARASVFNLPRIKKRPRQSLARSAQSHRKHAPHPERTSAS